MKTIHTIKINTKLEEGAIVYSLRGHDRMVAGFINTHAISVYHHKRCEFEPCSGEVYSIQHYVIKFVSDLRQVGLHYNITSRTCRSGHLLITVTFVLSLCILLYILIRYSGHLFNVVSGHHLSVISSVKPLYNGKFNFKIIPEVISKVQYFSQMYKKSRCYKIYCLI
jgi:hypothetical protein